MKNIVFLTLIYIAFIKPISAQSPSETARQYVLTHLVFYYVEHPESPFPSDIETIKLNVEELVSGNTTGHTRVFWDNPNNADVKDMLLKAVRPVANGGDRKFQRVLARVLEITGNKIQVYLYNDFNNAALSRGRKHSDWAGLTNCTNTITTETGSYNFPAYAAWPCARQLDDTSGEFAGHLGIGSYFFSAYATPAVHRPWKIATLVHELVHTQMKEVLETGTNSSNRYGNDDSHNLREILPSRGSAFHEGIANAFALRYHMYGEITNWFNNADSLYVENIAGCPTGTAAAHCIQQRLTNSGLIALGSCGKTNARCYKITQIGPLELLYCEGVAGNILYQYMEQFRSEGMLVRSLKTALPNMRTGYPFNALFTQMLKDGNNFGTDATTGTTRGQFLPLGILDYYTGYKLRDKATFERCFGFSPWNSSIVNIDSYWTTHRNTLLGFRSPATSWHTNQLRSFAEHLNVRPAASRAPLNSNPAAAPAIKKN